MQESFKKVERLTETDEAFIKERIQNSAVSELVKGEMRALLETHKKGGLSAKESKEILSDLFLVSFT